ncbi:MAG: TIGR04150 pseudo-rSAM protein [Bacteroidales bacterium]|nr:TIGR04150 pseudo-rSAM protein [Bacteroidota bacterium]MBL6950079.1 TIGR04150 pseudo-rSAM protein [Bacteroidales bacterium]
MKSKHQWLFLEPYVHLLRQKGTLFLYNSVTKVALEFTQSSAVYKLAGQLEKPVNGCVIPISANQLKDHEILNFINKLRDTFMGDLLDPAWSKGKPVNIFPEVIVKHSLEKKKNVKAYLTPDLDPRNYIQELTLFVITDSVKKLAPFSNAFLQFSFPACCTSTQEVMKIKLADSIMHEINNYTPTLIHISGSNIFSYPDLEELINLMATSPFQKKYHLISKNWEAETVNRILAQKNTNLALYITFPTHPDIIASDLRTLRESKLLKKIEFNFVISDDDELQMSQEIIQILDLENIYFKPYFTGENLEFFRENIFVSREEILAAQPDQQQVLSRLSINETDYGKFSITPDGAVYANLNDPELGNASKYSFIQLIEREIDSGVSWGRARKKVTPCKDCIYHFLCPPISSYEIFMKRFNFCDVVPNPHQP